MLKNSLTEGCGSVRICTLFLKSRLGHIQGAFSGLLLSSRLKVMCETHGLAVRVAGEVDLCGSLVNPVTGLSAGVVQDELVSHVTQMLVCYSCKI